MSVCKIKGTQFIKQRQLRAERGGIRGKKGEKLQVVGWERWGKGGGGSERFTAVGEPQGGGNEGKEGGRRSSALQKIEKEGKNGKYRDVFTGMWCSNR